MNIQNNYEYKEEFFSDILEEVKPMLIEHWKELANHQDIRPLDPDYDFYIKLNDVGVIRIFTLRLNGKLIGYSSFLVSNNLHYKTWLHANSDVYYLVPECRNMRIGVTFFLEIERWLKSLNVKTVTVQDKINHSHTEFFEKLGFKAIEQVYEKVL